MGIDEYQRLNNLKSNLERRAEMYYGIRDFFNILGFLEVETPVRVPVIAPELYITPVTSEDWYLNTSPELHMKRLLAAGYGKLFQICHCFRKDERGRWHNPEFTMLEWYRAGAGYLQMIEDTEELIISLAQQLGLGSRIKYQGKYIDLTKPWQRITVRNAFLQHAGWDPVIAPDLLRFDIDLCEKVIPSFVSDCPTVILDYPSPMASLARLKQGDSQVAERAEVFIGGLEIANAYSELIDPIEQKKRFRWEIELIEREHRRKMTLPVKFLEAMKSMPECGGIALGVDRLVMLLCDAGSIDEVIPFTEETA
jgi:elongation factor P--(R)-beta-lysine ligase